MIGNYSYRVFDGLIVACVSTEPPLDAEWDATCKELSLQRGASLAGLILTDGGGPNARQRAALRALAFGAHFRQAVLTSSVVARGIVTALAWLGMPSSAFSPDEAELAVAWLRLDEEKRRLALTTLAELRATMAGASSVEHARRAIRARDGDATILFRTPLRELREAVTRGAGGARAPAARSSSFEP